jgi:hypothetical protein
MLGIDLRVLSNMVSWAAAASYSRIALAVLMFKVVDY